MWPTGCDLLGRTSQNSCGIWLQDAGLGIEAHATMRAMPRKPSAKNVVRLADLMERRCVQLHLTWTQVAERGGTTTESIRQARNGKTMRALTQYAIERGLAWQQGSMQAILNGGDPVPIDVEPRLPDNTPGLPRPGGEVAAALAAIDAIPDDELVPEAKDHLRKQLGLLLRIERAKTAAANEHLDGELEARIVKQAKAIRSQPGLTDEQKISYVAAMESELRGENAAGRIGRDPHRDVVFEESDDVPDDVPDHEVADELARDPLGDVKSQQRR
jgi:hypothetical protein